MNVARHAAHGRVSRNAAPRSTRLKRFQTGAAAAKRAPIIRAACRRFSKWAHVCAHLSCIFNDSRAFLCNREVISHDRPTQHLQTLRAADMD
ncbi:MAG: hypothetical protein V4793_28185, partial [Paraburkholderia tropica]